MAFEGVWGYLLLGDSCCPARLKLHGVFFVSPEEERFRLHLVGSLVGDDEQAIGVR